MIAHAAPRGEGGASVPGRLLMGGGSDGRSFDRSRAHAPAARKGSPGRRRPRRPRGTLRRRSYRRRPAPSCGTQRTHPACVRRVRRREGTRRRPGPSKQPRVSPSGHSLPRPSSSIRLPPVRTTAAAREVTRREARSEEGALLHPPCATFPRRSLFTPHLLPLLPSFQAGLYPHVIAVELVCEIYSPQSKTQDSLSPRWRKVFRIDVVQPPARTNPNPRSHTLLRSFQRDVHRIRARRAEHALAVSRASEFRRVASRVKETETERGWRIPRAPPRVATSSRP